MNTDAILGPVADAIDGAEEILDPLAGLAEKTAADPLEVLGRRSKLSLRCTEITFGAPVQVKRLVGRVD